MQIQNIKHRTLKYIFGFSPLVLIYDTLANVNKGITININNAIIINQLKCNFLTHNKQYETYKITGIDMANNVVYKTVFQTDNDRAYTQ